MFRCVNVYCFHVLMFIASIFELELDVNDLMFKNNQRETLCFLKMNVLIFLFDAILMF